MPNAGFPTGVLLGSHDETPNVATAILTATNRLVRLVRCLVRCLVRLVRRLVRP